MAPKRRKSFFRPLPLIFTLTLMIYVFVTFLIAVTLPLIDEGNPTGEIFTVIVSVLFGMMFLSFFRVATTDPGRIPDWYNDPDKQEELEPLCVEKKADGSRRYCHKSSMWKPDRTHYCRVCQRCILKMDHHCPWINNCVGYANYKFFLLFITYSLCCCLFVFVVTLTIVPRFNTDAPAANTFMILFDCIVTGALSLALSAFVCFHYYLNINNYTTLEFLEKRGCGPSKGHVNYFDMGCYRNVQITMGRVPFCWPFPVKACTIDQKEGTYFETNSAYAEYTASKGESIPEQEA